MDSRTISFLILATLNLCHLNVAYVIEALDSSSPCPIYLTISPLGHSVESSYLEINWGPKCPNPAEWIALYSEDPTTSYAAPLYTTNTDNEPTGHIKTNVKLHKIHLPYGWNKIEVNNGFKPDHIKSACLPFYIASFNGKTLQTLDCLKIHPNWMKKMPQIRDIALKNLFIPGTHCSGCYEKRPNSRSILLEKFGYVQNFDVWTQLVFGVRYLDISVGYKDHYNKTNEPSNMWIVNENLFVRPLLSILQEIRLFAMLSKEVIVLNFVNFPIGFSNNPDRHFELLRILGTEFGDIAYIRPWDTNMGAGDLTIEMMDRYGKRIVILYGEEHIVEDSQLIWPSWRKFSTVNLQNNDLHDYIRKIFSKKFDNSPKNEPWIINGIQGVDVSYTPELHLPSSRDRANIINKVFTDAITNAWAINANVVAFDYFMSCNLIDLAIGTNIQKHFNNTNYLIIDIEE